MLRWHLFAQEHRYHRVYRQLNNSFPNNDYNISCFIVIMLCRCDRGSGALQWPSFLHSLRSHSSKEEVLWDESWSLFQGDAVTEPTTILIIAFIVFKFRFSSATNTYLKYIYLRDVDECPDAIAHSGAIAFGRECIRALESSVTSALHRLRSSEFRFDRTVF